ncbi:hypothetical protein HYT23_03325 [Candidatus Pacearchaeota archaeon]|nr:hypothetical protein [Candidatus Pacearchaeota archaeon]
MKIIKKYRERRIKRISKQIQDLNTAIANLEKEYDGRSYCEGLYNQGFSKGENSGDYLFLQMSAINKKNKLEDELKELDSSLGTDAAQLTDDEIKINDRYYLQKTKELEWDLRIGCAGYRFSGCGYNLPILERTGVFKRKSIEYLSHKAEYIMFSGWLFCGLVDLICDEARQLARRRTDRNLEKLKKGDKK